VNVPPIVSPRPALWDPQEWDIEDYLDGDDEPAAIRSRLTSAEVRWIDAWDDFVQTLRRSGEERLPGFPVWADHFVHIDDLWVDPETPTWKANFLRRNADLYTRQQHAIDAWLDRWGGLADFPPSRRKLEWQAQDARSLWDTVMHLRPSGIRAKSAPHTCRRGCDHADEHHRRTSTSITVQEAARLQGLPEGFDFGAQPDAASFRQLGNAVNVGAVRHVFSPARAA
jgi:DNA (cytosine-5)-methyltransferase 1